MKTESEGPLTRTAITRDLVKPVPHLIWNPQRRFQIFWKRKTFRFRRPFIPTGRQWFTRGEFQPRIFQRLMMLSIWSLWRPQQKKAIIKSAITRKCCIRPMELSRIMPTGSTGSGRCCLNLVSVIIRILRRLKIWSMWMYRASEDFWKCLRKPV